MEIGRFYLYKSQVGSGVGAYDGGCEIAVIVEGHFEAFGIGYHVVVGHDISVFADYNARAESYLLLLRSFLRFLPALTRLLRATEEKFEEWIAVILTALVAIGLSAAWGGIALYAHHAIDGLLGRTHEIGLGN